MFTYLLTYIRKVLLCEAGWMAFQTASATPKWTAMEVNWGNNVGGKIGHYPVLKAMKGDESDVPYERALSFKTCMHQNCWLNTVLQMVLWFCIHCHWYIILCVCNKGYLPTISMARKVLCESRLCLWQKQNKQTKTSANKSFVSVSGKKITKKKITASNTSLVSVTKKSSLLAIVKKEKFTASNTSLVSVTKKSSLLAIHHLCLWQRRSLLATRQLCLWPEKKFIASSVSLMSLTKQSNNKTSLLAIQHSVSDKKNSLLAN